jgi:HD-GYP domain-containing protein (c-di-GMP phosphodiesterase class II)/C4-dicarboxylate-specific signal transduction histidine kinase
MILKLLRWRDWSLATKLSVLFVAVLLAALSAFALVEDAQTRGQVIAQAHERNLQRARATAQLLDFYLASVDANVQLIAVAPGTLDFMGAVGRDEHREEIVQVLQFARTRGGYDAAFLLDPLGTVLLATDARLVGRNYTTAAWFRNAAAGRTTFDEPRYDAVDGQVYLHVSAPITTPRQEIIGAAVARLTMQPIDDLIMADVNYDGQGAFGVLFDYDGIRLSHSLQQDLRYTPLAPLPQDLFSTLVFEAHFGPATETLLQDATRLDAVVQRGKLLLFDAQMDPHIAFVERAAGAVEAALAPLKNKRWVYSIASPQANLFAQVNAQTQSALGQMLVIELIVLVVALLGARLVTLPVRRVAETARALAAGDLARRVRLDRRDEVGQLGAAFDAMADALAEQDAQLRGYAADLEQKVQARTHEIARRADEFAALFETTRDLAAQPDLADILQVIAARAATLLGAPYGAVYLYDAARQELELVVSRDPALPLGTRLKLNEGMAGRVATTREPLIVDDYRTWEHRSPQYTAASFTAVVEVPMLYRGEIVGVLLAYATGATARKFTDADARLLSLFASQAASAVQHARLLKTEREQRKLAETLRAQTEARLQRLAVLRNIDLAITASLNVHLTLNILLEEVTTQLRLDAAAVSLFNEHARVLEFAAGRGFRTTALQRTRLRLGEGLAGKAALERRTIALRDLRLEVGAPSNLQSLISNLQAEGFLAYYAAPLIAKGQIKGVLEIFHRAAQTLDPEWLEFLEALGAQAAIAIDSAEQFDRAQRSSGELALAYDTTLEGWSRALDLRDKETEGHTQRVTEMTERLARAMSVHEAELMHLHRGALLHDIGKMGIPDAILLKPGALTDAEWAIMRQHPQYAYDLLAPIAYLRPALDIPYCHHEKWDGSGYPRGLKGEEIPLAARIFALVDVWDALRSDRPYRAAWSEVKTLEHIRSQAGIHFDPRVVAAFMRLMESEGQGA